MAAAFSKGIRLGDGLGDFIAFTSDVAAARARAHATITDGAGRGDHGRKDASTARVPLSRGQATQRGGARRAHTPH